LPAWTWKEFWSPKSGSIFSKSTGIEELKLTTRDLPDYDVLMKRRLQILEEHGLGLPDIQKVIEEMGPMEGALDFVNWLRERYQVLILSDTFYEFAAPLMKQLRYPTLMCNSLSVEQDGRITNYHLRQPDQKRQVVKALHGLNFRVIAAGDSYNDTSMLGEADAGIFFCPPDNIVAEFPHFPVTTNYQELRKAFTDFSDKS